MSSGASSMSCVTGRAGRTSATRAVAAARRPLADQPKPRSARRSAAPMPVGDPPERERQRIQAGVVQPLHVIDRDQNRPAGRAGPQRREHGQAHRCAVGGCGPADRSSSATSSACSCGAGMPAAISASTSGEQVGQPGEGQVGLASRRLGAQHPVAGLLGGRDATAPERGLARAGLAFSASTAGDPRSPGEIAHPTPLRRPHDPAVRGIHAHISRPQPRGRAVRCERGCRGRQRNRAPGRMAPGARFCAECPDLSGRACASGRSRRRQVDAVAWRRRGCAGSWPQGTADRAFGGRDRHVLRRAVGLAGGRVAGGDRRDPGTAGRGAGGGAAAAIRRVAAAHRARRRAGCAGCVACLCVPMAGARRC